MLLRTTRHLMLFVLLLSALGATSYFLLRPPAHHVIDGTKLTVSVEHQNNALLVHTLYGDFTVTEPVLIDLFNSKAMERIKDIRQYGVTDYIVTLAKPYTRFEHSVGVWALLRLHGARLEEQIAGLLHDASHTIFSHVGDHLFHNKSLKHSYQDEIHEWYLQKMGVDKILEKHGITLHDVLHKSGAHAMLECDLPDLCADRFEYNMQGGLLINTLTVAEVQAIAGNAHYADGRWYFTDQYLARKLADASLYNTEYMWGSPDWSYIVYTWAVDALKRALELKLITSDDIHFSTDDKVWDLLGKSDDEVIKNCMHKILHYQDYVTVGADDDYNLVLKTKFRGIDPWIKTSEGFKRLTQLDPFYKKSYDSVKKRLTQGQRIKIIQSGFEGVAGWKQIVS